MCERCGGCAAGDSKSDQVRDRGSGEGGKVVYRNVRDYKWVINGLGSNIERFQRR